MATKEELYLSISKEKYIQSKSSILRSQEDMLNAMKHLYNLKVLARLKNDLKKTLLKLSKSVESEIEKIQDRMPTTKIPKTVNYKRPEISKPKSRTGDLSQKWDIESELRVIQEKLQKLNS